MPACSTPAGLTSHANLADPIFFAVEGKQPVAMAAGQACSCSRADGGARGTGYRQAMASRSARARRPFPLVAMLLALALSAFAPPADGESTREARPLTLSGAANAILPSLGVDLSYQFADRVGVGAQVTSLLWAHVDFSLRSRFLALARPTWGLYVGANLHGWYSPLIIHGVSPLATSEIGYEYRGDSGTTIGVGLGGGPIYIFNGEGRQNRIEPVFIGNLRIGKSW